MGNGFSLSYGNTSQQNQLLDNQDFAYGNLYFSSALMAMMSGVHIFQNSIFNQVDY
jgi:hypothetical protein